MLGKANARTTKYTKSSYFERQTQEQNPNLVHPIPFRAISSQVHILGRPQSGYSGSVVAQVGPPIPPVSLSQIEENSRWTKWLGKSTASLITEEAGTGDRMPSEGAEISPGVSERWAAREWSQTLSALTDITPIESTEESYGQTRGLLDTASPSEFSQILTQYDGMLPESCESHEDFGLEEPHSQFPESRGTVSETDSTLGDAICLTPTAIPRVPAEPEADPGEAWKQFVFGDDNIDDFMEQALNEAKKQAARDLLPSDCSTCITEEPVSELDSIAVVPGTPFTGLIATHTVDNGLSSAAVSASREATYAPSSAKTPSDLTPSSPHAASQPSQIVVEAGSNISPGVDSSTNNGDPCSTASTELGGNGREVQSTQPSAAPSVVTSIAVEPSQSVAGAEQQFRFAPPKLFVGSHSTPNQVTRPTGAAVPLNFARKRRGRQRKRALDGRADIRALPNYGGDPIEDIEDDDVAQSSMFGALEVV